MPLTFRLVCPSTRLDGVPLRLPIVIPTPVNFLLSVDSEKFSTGLSSTGLFIKPSETIVGTSSCTGSGTGGCIKSGAGADTGSGTGSGSGSGTGTGSGTGSGSGVSAATSFAGVSSTTFSDSTSCVGSGASRATQSTLVGLIVIS